LATVPDHPRRVMAAARLEAILVMLREMFVIWVLAAHSGVLAD
jgi:hypothetical protein